LVKIRLKRMGTTKRPVYRLVVADSRSPRDGRFIESIGFYDPLPNPAVVRIDTERVQLWLKRGARPSDSARQLLVNEGILAARPFTVTVREPAAEPVKAKANGATKAAAAEAPAEAGAAPEAPVEATAASEEAPETELEAEVAEIADLPADEPAADATPEADAAGPSAEASEDAEATADDAAEATPAEPEAAE
jgi:small subunit ribosomal protein S16